MKRLSAHLGLVAIALFAHGCFPQVWKWEPDLSDPLDWIGPEFELEESCERSDPLEVELGFGELNFIPMPESHAFEVIYGLQGGTHVFAGLRIANPERDHPLVEVVFELLDNDLCQPDADEEEYSEYDIPSPGYAAPAPGAECPSRRTGYRRGVMNANEYLNAQGAMEAAGLQIFHEFDTYGGGTADRVHVTVRDQCGRVGKAERKVTER